MKYGKSPINYDMFASSNWTFWSIVKKSFFFITGTFLVVMPIIVFTSYNKFTFELDGNVYKTESVNYKETVYCSKTANKRITIRDKTEYKEITINEKIYKVWGIDTKGDIWDENSKIKVEYPQGKIEELTHSEFITSRINIGNESKNQNIHFNKLIEIAFESEKHPCVNLKKFIKGAAVFIFGFIGLKYPETTFKINYLFSLRNGEPSEVYLIYTMIGGLILMIIGSGFMISSIMN